MIIGLLICFLTLLNVVFGAHPLNASLIPEEERDYNIKDNFSRLLAHTSLLIKDEDGQKIVIDGGMAKFKFKWKGKESEVPDLNGHIAILRLDQDFSIDQLPLDIYQKSTNIPVTNRGYMWADSKMNIYIAGGHFFGEAYWDESAYYVQKASIPDYSIWKFDIKHHNWTEIYPHVDSRQHMTRMISSGYTSIPKRNLSYSFGGYWSDRSNRDTPYGVSMASNGMIIYDHAANAIQNITDNSDNSGYTHGFLHHIAPASGHKGILLSLMAKKYPLHSNFSENDPEKGTADDFVNIRFFDLEENKWYTQRATFLENEKPITRTRFCSVVVRDPETNNWDLFIYGGQSTQSPLNGNQMLVIGGYPPSYRVDPAEKCDSQLMRVFDLSLNSWGTDFKVNTTYKQPDEVREWTLGRTKPLKGNLHPNLKAVFDPPPKPKGKIPTWAIIVICVIAVIFVILILVAIWAWKRYRKHRNNTRSKDNEAHQDSQYRTNIPSNTRPEPEPVIPERQMNSFTIDHASQGPLPHTSPPPSREGPTGTAPPELHIERTGSELIRDSRLHDPIPPPLPLAVAEPTADPRASIRNLADESVPNTPSPDQARWDSRPRSDASLTVIGPESPGLQGSGP